MKPLGRKAYGSIPHLPQSRMGPADHHCHEGQARICLEKTRDKHDVVIVQEKLDGSCVAAAKRGGEIIALGRAGFLASSSPYRQHHLWADWVEQHRARFDATLREGEWLCGEWLALAHGTRYELRHEPFVAFDLFGADGKRLPYETFAGRADEFCLPTLLHFDDASCPLADALRLLGDRGFHGAVDEVEGVVYRVERGGVVDFLAKWVRPTKVDGRYLPEMCGGVETWNWQAAA